MLLVQSHALFSLYEGTREILVVRNSAHFFLCESLWFDCLPLTAVDVAVMVDFHVFQLVELGFNPKPNTLTLLRLEISILPPT